GDGGRAVRRAGEMQQVVLETGLGAVRGRRVQLRRSQLLRVADALLEGRIVAQGAARILLPENLELDRRLRIQMRAELRHTEPVRGRIRLGVTRMKIAEALEVLCGRDPVPALELGGADAILVFGIVRCDVDLRPAAAAVERRRDDGSATDGERDAALLAV